MGVGVKNGETLQPEKIRDELTKLAIHEDALIAQRIILRNAQRLLRACEQISVNRISCDKFDDRSTGFFDGFSPSVDCLFILHPSAHFNPTG